jgi:hypothetical protein
METHVKVLGVLNMLSGALGVCLALLLLLIFGGVAGAVGSGGDPGSTMAAPLIGLTGVTLVVFLLIMSAPAILVGYGLYRVRPWARVAGIAIAILSLMAFPLGTVLGIYGLWVLCSQDGARLFTTVRTT